jgi:cyclophilin family peptidyl-prolyl cis-trans isomerase
MSKRSLFANNSETRLAARAGELAEVLFGTASPVVAEQLEHRTLMAISVLNAVPDSSVQPNAPATLVSLAGRYDNTDLNGTIVKFATDRGDINVLMYDQTNPGVTRSTPLTVANFLRYMNAGRYNDTIFHRSASNFVIQGGGFSRPTTSGDAPGSITSFPAVLNEPGNTNVRGTIAMAKLGGDANSATNQWFFNLNDSNAGNLDSQNGGFTVFGRVIKGLDVMDNIAALRAWNFGEPFNELPLIDHIQDAATEPREFVGMRISGISELAYTVTSSNPTLVAPSLSGTDLTLTYAAGLTGSSVITVHIACADGTSIDDTFTVRVNTPPVIDQLTATPAAVGRNTNFTLSLGSVVDDGGLARVDYYRDTDADGVLTIGVDSLLGSANSSAGSWAFTANTNGLSSGLQRYFAIATDIDGSTSSTITATVVVQNAAPVVSAFSVTPDPVRGNGPVILTASAADPDGEVTLVRFFRDSNNNGTFDLGTDASLGQDADAAGGYSIVVDTAGFGIGSIRYFAVATDAEGRTGEAVAVVGVIKAPFSIGELTIVPASILRNGSITLTASSITLADETRLRSVTFYLDSNANGVYDSSDKKVASTSTFVGEGSLLVGLSALSQASTKGLGVGSARYFARALSSAGIWSEPVTQTVTILNNAPSFTAVRSSTTTVRNLGDTLSLSVAGTKDVDGRIASVTYYRDAGGTPDNALNPSTDSLLGTVTKSSDNWRLSFATTGFVVGINRIFAVVVDNDGAVSPSQTMTVRVNAAPTVTSFSVTPTTGVKRSAIFTLSTSGVADSDGSIERVEYYFDKNGNGALDIGTDKFLASGKLVNGVWTLSVDSKSLPIGKMSLFARAMDKQGAFSRVLSAQVEVTQS